MPKSKAVGGVLQWMRFAPTLLMQAQAKGALAHAKLLTGNRMLRITESVSPDRFKLDDPRCIEELRALGDQAARHAVGWFSTHLGAAFDVTFSQGDALTPSRGFCASSTMRTVSGAAPSVAELKAHLESLDDARVRQ